MSLASLRKAHPWTETPPDVPSHDHGHFIEVHKKFLNEMVPKDASVILEIGTWLGSSARYMVDLAPDATIITIDHFKVEERYKMKDYPFRERLKDTFIANTWDYRDRVIFLHMDSLEGIRVVSRHSISPDFIYIDGDHSKKGFGRDLRAVLEHFPCAVITGDDINQGGVREVLKDYDYEEVHQLWRLR